MAAVAARIIFQIVMSFEPDFSCLSLSFMPTLSDVSLSGVVLSHTSSFNDKYLDNVIALSNQDLPQVTFVL